VRSIAVKLSPGGFDDRQFNGFVFERFGSQRRFAERYRRREERKT
jgi:hypothetical protein